MGQSSASRKLDDATQRAADRLGKLPVSGRYHRLPKRIQDDYDMQSIVLGTGYSGAVYQARGKRTKRKYAVKAFKLQGIPRDKRNELHNEVEIFLSIDHPHIARLVDAYEGDDVLSLVMECMEGGELYQRVVDRKRFSEKDAADAVWQMLLAVNYIHSHGIVHRDLKLENFLYETRNSDYLKLIDFGFSKVWEPDTLMAVSCGTLAYVAPEVLEKSYTDKCDLWSIGVITFILLVGYMPFSGPEPVQVACIKNARYTYKQEQWSRVSKAAHDFVNRLLVVDTGSRYSAAQALEDEWMKAPEQGASGPIDDAVIKSLCKFAQETKFKRAAFSVMAWSLSREDREQVRQAFMKMDKEHTGTVTLADLRNVMQENYEIDDDSVRAIFAALDTNDDQEIHYSEFLAAMVSTRIRVHDTLLKETFRRFDTDNTGYISLQNLQDVLGESFDNADVEQLLKEADIKSDGKISWEEFIAYLKGTTMHPKLQQAADAMIDKEQSRASTSSKFESPFKIRRRAREGLQRISSAFAGRKPTLTSTV